MREKPIYCSQCAAKLDADGDCPNRVHLKKSSEADLNAFGHGYHKAVIVSDDDIAQQIILGIESRIAHLQRLAAERGTKMRWRGVQPGTEHIRELRRLVIELRQKYLNAAVTGG